MKSAEFHVFLDLIRNQFDEETRETIQQSTDLKTLKEWTSLQTMIIVNEIDSNYNVILDFKDIKKAGNVMELFEIVQTKLR